MTAWLRALALMGALIPLAGCSAADPAPIVVPYQPTIAGVVTKAGAPAAGRRIALVAYAGRKEGLFEGLLAGTVAEATTDEAGRYTLNVPLARVMADELFGVSYDPVPERPALRTQNTNPDEIRAFDTPAIWLHAKQGLKATVSFDVAWDTRACKPAFAGSVKAANLPFDVAPYAGAIAYDVTVVRGTLDAQADEAFFGRLTPTRQAMVWSAPTAGQYVWQARAYVSPTGIPDVAAFRVVAPAFALSVAGLVTVPIPDPTPAVPGDSPRPVPTAS